MFVKFTLIKLIKAHHRAIKKNKSFLYVKTWMDHINIILRGEKASIDSMFKIRQS